MRSKHLRYVLAAALAAAAVVVFAGLGYASPAGSSSAAQYEDERKVTICHKGKTIRVSVNALPAHERHADVLGTCANAEAKGVLKGKAKGKLKAKGKMKGKARGKRK